MNSVDKSNNKIDADNNQDDVVRVIIKHSYPITSTPNKRAVINFPVLTLHCIQRRHETLVVPNSTLEILTMSSSQKSSLKKRPEADVISDNSMNSESATLMSSHAMKMVFYTINLGTAHGQKLHTCHLVLLPLIPVFILLSQVDQFWYCFLVCSVSWCSGFSILCSFSEAQKFQMILN
jgi:hypothetical protein